MTLMRILIEDYIKNLIKKVKSNSYKDIPISIDATPVPPKKVVKKLTKK